MKGKNIDLNNNIEPEVRRSIDKMRGVESKYVVGLSKQ
jgi:hypothetical protein